MTTNWTSNFATIQHSYISNDPNIDDLFKKKEEDINVIKMIELKELLLNLIQEKEDIDLTEDEKKEIGLTEEEKEEKEGEEGEEGKEGKEGEKGEEGEKGIQGMIPKIKQYIQDFLKLQEDLDQINDNFKDEIKLLKQNISTIENMINFLKKLPEEHKDDTIMKNIIDNMNELSKKIEKNDTIKELRKEYVRKRKEIEIYLQFIKQLNNFNQCNLCPVCFTNPVDHFVDPCGHTFCKGCITTLRKNQELDLYEIGRNDNSQCCFCRERVKTIRQLYFL